MHNPSPSPQGGPYSSSLSAHLVPGGLGRPGVAPSPKRSILGHSLQDHGSAPDSRVVSCSPILKTRQERCSSVERAQQIENEAYMVLQKQRKADVQHDVWSQQKTEQFRTKDIYSDTQRLTDLKSRIHRVLSAETEFLRKGDDWRSGLPPSQGFLFLSPTKPQSPQTLQPKGDPDVGLQVRRSQPQAALQTHAPQVASRTESPAKVSHLSSTTGPTPTRYTSPVRLHLSAKPQTTVTSKEAPPAVPRLNLDSCAASAESLTARPGPKLKPSVVADVAPSAAKQSTNTTPRKLSARSTDSPGWQSARDAPQHLTQSIQARLLLPSNCRTPSPRTPEVMKQSPGRAPSPATKATTARRGISPTISHRIGSPALTQRTSSPTISQRAASPAVSQRTSPVTWRRTGSPGTNAFSNLTPPPAGRTASPAVNASSRRSISRHAPSPAKPSIGAHLRNRSPASGRSTPGYAPLQTTDPKTSAHASTTTSRTNSPSTRVLNAKNIDTAGLLSQTGSNAKLKVTRSVTPSSTTEMKGFSRGAAASNLFHSWKPQPKPPGKPSSVSQSTARGVQRIIAGDTKPATIPAAVVTRTTARSGQRGTKAEAGISQQTLLTKDQCSEEQWSEASSWNGNVMPPADLLQPFADELDGVLAGVESELEQLRLSHTLALQPYPPWKAGSLLATGSPASPTIQLGPPPQKLGPPSTPEPHGVMTGLHTAGNLLDKAASGPGKAPTPTSSPQLTADMSAFDPEPATPVRPIVQNTSATPPSWGPRSPPPQDLVIFPPPPCPVTDPKFPNQAWETLGDVTASDIPSSHCPHLPQSPSNTVTSLNARAGPPPQPVKPVLANPQAVDERVAKWVADHPALAVVDASVEDMLDYSSIAYSEGVSEPMSPMALSIMLPSPRGNAPRTVLGSLFSNLQLRPQPPLTMEAKPSTKAGPAKEHPIAESAKMGVSDAPTSTNDDQWYKQMQQRLHAQLQRPRSLADPPAQSLCKLYPELVQEIQGRISQRTEQTDAAASTEQPSPEATPVKVPPHPLQDTPEGRCIARSTSPIVIDKITLGTFIASALTYSSEIWKWVTQVISATKVEVHGSTMQATLEYDRLQRLSLQAWRLLCQSHTPPSREDLVILAEDVSDCLGCMCPGASASKELWSIWVWQCRAIAALCSIQAVAAHVLEDQAQSLSHSTLVEAFELLLARYRPSPVELFALRSWLRGPRTAIAASFVSLAPLFWRADCLAVCKRGTQVVADIIASAAGYQRSKVRLPPTKKQRIPGQEESNPSLLLPTLINAGMVEQALAHVEDLHGREAGVVDALLGCLPGQAAQAAVNGLNCDDLKDSSRGGPAFLVYYYEQRDERLCAWLVANGAVHFRYLRDLHDVLDCLQHCEQPAQPGGGVPADSEADDDFIKWLGKLYHLLLMPFESVLIGVSTRRLAIIPHGQLWGVPFMALPSGLSHSRPMIDEWEICVTQSCRVYMLLADIASVRATSPVSCPILIVGSPDPGQWSAMLQESRSLVAEVQRLTAVRYMSATSLTAPSVLQAVQQVSHLHISCPLPSNDDPAADVGGMELPSGCTRTAVLNLCGQGALTLLPAIRVLLGAGVPSIITTLQPVPPAVAVAFSSGFYRHVLLHKLTPMEAWRVTIQNLRDQKVGLLVWSQFAFLGHPGAL